MCNDGCVRRDSWEWLCKTKIMLFCRVEVCFRDGPPSFAPLLPTFVSIFGLERANCSQKPYKIAASEKATSGVAIRYFRRAVRLLHASSSLFRGRDALALPSPEGLKAAVMCVKNRLVEAEEGRIIIHNFSCLAFAEAHSPHHSHSIGIIISPTQWLSIDEDWRSDFRRLTSKDSFLRCSFIRQSTSI